MRRRPHPAPATGVEGSDPVPAEVVERAQAAFEARSTGPVAAVVSDVDDHGARHLHFVHELARLDLRVAAAGTRRDLRGQVDPPQLRVELELEGSAITVTEDAASDRFGFAGVPGGIMRVRLFAREGAAPVATEWFRA